VGTAVGVGGSVGTVVGAGGSVGADVDGAAATSVGSGGSVGAAVGSPHPTGVTRTADLDKIRLRRVFREIAELMCSSTIAWRSSPEDHSCEQEVNHRTEHLPLGLNRGRIEDQADPQLTTDGLVEMYRAFLLTQLDVVSRRFGREHARQSFERTLRQLAPELQKVARRYHLDKLLAA
jgi:hypothetical protein